MENETGHGEMNGLVRKAVFFQPHKPTKIFGIQCFSDSIKVYKWLYLTYKVIFLIYQWKLI